MKLKRDAEAFLGDTVTQAVITVPAYFDDAQRTATKEAGTIAGLEVLRIINEPTAAALAYGLDKGSEDETVLVFDLGGGTFDVSVLEIGDGVFEVKSTHGDTSLGGDDWDQRVIDWLVTQFKNAQGVDLSSDRMAMQRLKEAAEKAKIELSQVQSTQINLPFITANADGPLHLDETLSRSKFQEMTADLIERCRVPFEQALKDAGISKGDLEAAARTYGHHFGDSEVKSNLNVFTQNPWYLGRLAETAAKVPLKKLIDFQVAFTEAFEAIIERPNDQEEVCRELAVSCLS